MIKICFVVPRAYYLFNPDANNFSDKIGGAQKQSYLLSTELAKNKDFDVNFCVADFGQNNFEEIKNVKIWKTFNFNNFIIKKFLDLYRTLKKINADFYIFRATDLSTSIILMITRIILQKKIIYMVASDTEVCNKTNRNTIGFAAALIMKRNYRRSYKVTVQSLQQFNLFLENYKRKPDAIIKNIIEIEENQKNTIRNNILWIGRLDKIKNPYLVLELAEKYKNENFVMIAPVVRDFVDYGKEFLKKAAVYKNVKIIEFVKPTEIKKYFEKAKIYLMTSESEGFSNTMMEAMQNKCPVLSYKVNNDNIFGKYEIGFCANGDFKLFSDYFEKLSNNLDLQTKFGLNGFNYLQKNHDKQQIINEFIKLFEN